MRRIGDAVVATTGRRLRSGRWASGAGVQLRRTATPPLLPFEYELGIAIKVLSYRAHPFTVPANLPADLAKAISFATRPVADIRDFRKARLVHWRRRAEALKEKTLDFISQVQDEGSEFQTGYHRSAELGLASAMCGTFFLWCEMLLTINSTDVGLCNATDSSGLSNVATSVSLWTLRARPCSLWKS